MGYCPDAWTAPTRPKVQENRLTFEIAQGDALALQIVEGEVGRGLAGFELGGFSHNLLDGLGVCGIGVVSEEFTQALFTLVKTALLEVVDDFPGEKEVQGFAMQEPLGQMVDDVVELD